MQRIESELVLTNIHSPGPGGQNVNKVATAIQLRFNVVQSNVLPTAIKTRLLEIIGRKLTQQGELIIKAYRHRTREKNKQDALQRLQDLIERASIPVKKRKATKVPYSARQERLETKKRRSGTKIHRGKRFDISGE